MSLWAMLGSLVDAFAIDPQPETPPAEASLETVADYCGIRNPHAVAAAVPLETYRGHGGRVACTVSAAEPNPPEVIVANYELPGGSRKVLAADAYADILQQHYPLDESEARALAYVRAGWAAQDLHGVVSDSRFDKAEIVQDAREALEKAGGTSDAGGGVGG
jgi:hypothetical protein